MVYRYRGDLQLQHLLIDINGSNSSLACRDDGLSVALAQ
jgi:hypothetical protein